jgi:hypothetical protein
MRTYAGGSELKIIRIYLPKILRRIHELRQVERREIEEDCEVIDDVTKPD